MTIMNFILQEDLVGIVTDSVVSHPTDMGPMLFTTKVYPVPHWKGLICGTGIMNVVTEWAFVAMTSILARDIVHLDEYAPAALQGLFDRVGAELGATGTVTLYHFGFNSDEDRFVGFAYRSTNNFASERLQYGIGLKPDPELSEDEDVNITSFPDDLVSLARLQKAKDEAKPVEDRVGIGGELFSYLMQPDGQGNIFQSISRCGAFEDFQASYQRACGRLPGNS